jgi:hypothetical protein
MLVEHIIVGFSFVVASAAARTAQLLMGATPQSLSSHPYVDIGHLLP